MMKRTNTILITTIILSITLASVFAFDYTKTDVSVTQNVDVPFTSAEADEPSTHEIKMEAVKMPDGMYAYRVVEYTLIDSEEDEVRNLVDEGIYDSDPSIPGPTIVLTEGDEAIVTLTNKACDDNMEDGGVGDFENSLVGIHVHGVHYNIEDDATYKRVNGSEDSAAGCDSEVTYRWVAAPGTAGTWPYHDHTFSQNEVGAEDLGLFGTVIVNPEDGELDGFIDKQGDIEEVNVEDIEKEVILWMVSSETLGRSVFYGMEIDNENGGKQTPLWINPPLYATEGDKVRFHVLGVGDEVHAFHLHGHRWVESQGGSADILDVQEISPLQRKVFIIEASDNGDDAQNTEGWMYHCHVFDHMQQGMSGMFHVLPEEEDDELPEVGAVFTISDEPGLWMKTLNAGIADDLDEVLASLGLPVDPRPGTGFQLDYLGILSPEFADTQGRSLAIINPGETVLFNMKDSQTKHTITTLVWPEEAEQLGGNGVVQNSPFGALGHFDTQLGIRGSSFLVDDEGKPKGLDEPGLYVFVCKIHPYMFSAVIVDNPETKIHSTTLQTDLPLLDLGANVKVLTRVGDNFPTTVPTTDALPLGLLKTFYVVTDPSNWKDYNKDFWDVNLPPAPLTTDDSTLLALAVDPATATIIADTLKPVVAGTEDIPEEDGGPVDLSLAVLGLDHHISIDNSGIPDDSGIGEVWVNTQFERTLNKNPDGTPQDKPGTLTVVNTDDWSIERKISLPDINMNHPHNMWTDVKNEVIYQTQWFDSRMVAIDRESGEMLKDVFVGQSPSHVMTSPETGTIYVAINGEDHVTELDPTTLEITKQISTGPRSHPHGHWIGSDGKYMVTPDFISLSSTIVNLEDGTSKKAIVDDSAALFDGTTVLLGPIATGMTSANSGDHKYFTADFLGNTMSVINPNTGKAYHQIDLLTEATNEDFPLVGLPIQTPVSPDDKWMVTAHVLGSAITVIDVESESVVATLPCDPGCHGVQWGANEDGGYYAYVSNKFSNALIVVDPDPNGDDDGTDATIAGKVILTQEYGTAIDDPVIGYDGMGGQGVLAIPNVYPGWIEATLSECGTSENPCSQEIVDYLGQLQ